MTLLSLCQLFSVGEFFLIQFLISISIYSTFTVFRILKEPKTVEDLKEKIIIVYRSLNSSSFNTTNNNSLLETVDFPSAEDIPMYKHLLL